MKKGKNLVQLCEQLTAERQMQNDYIAPVDHFHFSHDSLHIRDHGVYAVNEPAHQQIAAWLDIPNRFYNRLRETYPDQYHYVTTAIQHKEHQNQSRLIRTHGDKARAFLSNRYRPLDHYDLFEAIWPSIESHTANLVLESAEITDTHFYLKVVNHSLAHEISRKDNAYGIGHNKVETLKPGFVISNSETGHGQLWVSPLIYTVECTNGLIFKNQGVNKKHLGKPLVSDVDMSVLTDETKLARDKATFLECRDIIAQCLDEETFKSGIEKMTIASNDSFDPLALDDVITKVSKVTLLSDSEQKDVIRNILRADSYTRLDIVNAITRLASDVNSYDRSTELEIQANKVINLPRSQWNRLAEAA